MRRARGFTLVELLAAAALFAMLAVLLFQMVRSAMDVWGTGERNRELSDRAAAAFELVATDLRAAWGGSPGGGPRAALLFTWRTEDDDGDGLPERRLPLLRFTRLLHEQATLEWLAAAGDTPGGLALVTGLLPADPATLRPTGGLAESLYTLACRPGAGLPLLVRAVRAPAGGERSLLDPELAGQPDRLLADTVEVAEDVLFFGCEFWGPATSAWGPAGGALAAWDSTRGLLAPDDPDFPFGAGAASLDRPHDDVWPRLVRLTLVLDRVRGATASGTLAAGVSGDERRLRLAGAAFLRDEEPPDHLLVEDEWVAVTAIEGDEVRVTRGARGSVATSHADGVRVRAGRTFRRVLRLSAGRELLLTGEGAP